MADTNIAKLMWDAYATQAGGKTFDGKPLPTWDELGDERQSCWAAAASVISGHIEKLEAQLAQSQFTRWAARFEEQSDRIEKLEAALNRIVSLTDCWENSLISQVNEIAREALEEEDDPTG